MSLDLSAAVAAVRDGWPGHHFTRDAALFEAQTVRDGGATACLIEYAVETAAPLIEAQVRAQVAAEIHARIGAEPLFMYVTDWVDGMETAEEIARGAS